MQNVIFIAKKCSLIYHNFHNFFKVILPVRSRSFFCLRISLTKWPNGKVQKASSIPSPTAARACTKLIYVKKCVSYDVYVRPVFFIKKKMSCCRSFGLYCPILITIIRTLYVVILSEHSYV